MKTISLRFVLLIFMIGAPRIVECQKELLFRDEDPTGTILPALQSQVRVQYGNRFEVYYVVLDSMIGNIPIADAQEAITDPFGTLKGTVFFWGAPTDSDPENEDSVIVGMFKSGSIIWSTPPIYKGGVKQIYASRDLNKDGEVDLITLWSPSYSYAHNTNIMIFSWNGSTGRLISDIDPETRKPKMTTTGSILRLIKKRNGIYDIRAYWSDAEDMKDLFPSDPISTRPWVTYTWDGSKYVLKKRMR